MGKMLGPKLVAISLMALTDGDRTKAKNIWAAIADQEPQTWTEAWDLVELARAADAPKTWPCMVCEEPIRVNPDARLGECRYMHLDPVIVSSHDAIRGPDQRSE